MVIEKKREEETEACKLCYYVVKTRKMWLAGTVYTCMHTSAFWGEEKKSVTGKKKSW
jgi:hypothetical protein